MGGERADSSCLCMDEGLDVKVELERPVRQALLNLKVFVDEGHISEAEYTRRLSELVDRATTFGVIEEATATLAEVGSEHLGQRDLPPVSKWSTKSSTGIESKATSPMVSYFSKIGSKKQVARRIPSEARSEASSEDRYALLLPRDESRSHVSSDEEAGGRLSASDTVYSGWARLRLGKTHKWNPRVMVLLHDRLQWSA